MTINCEVQYQNNPQAIFYAGESINGNVVLNLSEVCSVNALFVKIEGFAAVHWSERRAQGQRHRSRHFSSRQDYLSTVIPLLGGQNGPATDIPPGTHTYKFTCALPATLPTSFEGQHGQIRYTVTILVEQSSQRSTTYREGFTVLKNVNLNDDPWLMSPKKLELSKTFGWWIFKSDPLNIEVVIPSTGYVSGQRIPVVVKWDNNSNVFIHGVRIKLYKNEEYQATDPYEKKRSIQHSVVKVENRDMHKQGQVKFERSLTIPTVPPTSISELIAVSYEVVVYVHISTGDNPVFTVPITIGTIPLMGPFPSPSTSDGGPDQPPPPNPPPIGFNVNGLPTDNPPNKSGAPVPAPSTSSTNTAPSTTSADQATTHSSELREHSR